MSEAGPALLAHMLAGLAAITAGFVALFAPKGRVLHRKSGQVFVAAMVVMATMGAAMAAMKFHIHFQKLNTVAGLLTVYLVASALLTVRRRSAPGAMDTAAMLFALGVGLFSFWIGLTAMNRPKATWFPAVPALIFGLVALLCAYGDFRMIRAGGLKGAPRIVRHLWRMCFALCVAAGSFFLGQAKVFPEAVRIFPVLAAPVLLVLFAMVYWWVRMRVWPPRWTLPMFSGER